MALTQLNQLAIAFKKLAGKAHTNSSFGIGNEAVASFVQLGTTTLFGEPIPTTLIPSSIYGINGPVEKVRLSLEQIDLSQYQASNPGGLTGATINASGDGAPTIGTFTNGIHAYKLKLPSDYQSNSSNPKAGISPFTNNSIISDSAGGLQLIPNSFAAGYAAAVYDSAGQIAPGDEDDYYVDYSTGILFIQDVVFGQPPVYVDAYLYIGKYLADPTLSYSGSFSGSFQGNGAGLTNVPASGIIGLNLTQIADSQVSASVSATGTPFTITSASVNLLTVDNQGLVSATRFTGSFGGLGSGSFSGSFQGISSGSFSGSFQGDGAGLVNLPASSIVGLNLSQIGTGSVTGSTAPDGTVFRIISASIDLLTLDNSGNLVVSGSEVIGNHITAKGNATITGSLTVNGTTTLNNNLSVTNTFTVGNSSSLHNTTVTGSLLVTQNLTVLGTASFTSVTSSEITIGASIITLSTDDPVVRFGGIVVIDSGSFGIDSTGSLLWDSERNHWIYGNPSGSSYDGGGIMSGPRNAAGLGNETYPTKYSVLRGQGGDHLEDSNIYSTGSYITINKGGTGSKIAEVDILGSVVITGSTLLPSPDGAVSNKYALVTSQSAWHYSDNVGYPAGTNQWNSGLNGSYFNIFTPNTDTATILRFLAGLLSSSAPAPTPNTRTYNTVTANETNLGSTATVSVLSDQRLSLGYTSSAQISQAFKDTVNYGIRKGWSAVGTEGNGEGTQPWKQAGTAYYENFSTYNYTFTSNASSGTGGNGSDFFDLGTLDPAKDLKVRLIGSMSFSDTASVTSPNASTGLLTQTKTLDFSRSVGATTALDGNGLGLATIYTANPAVIPNTFQDARFSGTGGTPFLTRSFGTSLVAANTVSSSGYYNFYGMQAGVTSGSSTSYIFKTTSNVSRLWLPITAIQTSMSATPASITGGTFVSSSLTIAPSRSYSGVPYLTTGTSTWTYLGTGSGMFDPAFLNGVVFRQSISETLPGTVLIAGSSNSDVSCNTSGIATSGKVYDAVGNVKNSGLPRINDQVRSNVVITHSISSGDSNIADTGFSTGTTFTAATLGYTYTGSTGATLNTSTLPYHQAGTYGQPTASGSLGIYGGGTSNSALAEYFTSESNRRVISNSTTLTTQWNEATALTLGNHGGLQVKPSTTNGYLVNPESSKGYWYPTGGYNASHYKWYMRQFTYSGYKGTVTITLNPNNVSSLTTFDTTTANSYAIGLIFEYQVNNRGGGNVVLFDVMKGNAAYNSGTQTTGQFNPFSNSIEVQGNFLAPYSTTSGVITLTLDNGIGQVVDTGALNIWMVVRCIGTPSNTLRQITLS